MKTILLELNEFSFPLLKQGAKLLGLEEIEKILSFHKSETKTDDTYDNGFLEPWSQWVSVHTGISSKEHQIKHLGDVPHLKTSQIWERLSDKGISSGIWGAMNAGRNTATQCQFFLPDPWTFSEKAYPEDLNTLLLPLRYASKNYTQKKCLPLIQQGGHLVRFLKQNHLLGYFIKNIPSLVYNLYKHSKKPFVFISFFDSLSTKLFLKYKEKYNPDFSILFLNSLAHLQHHQWNEEQIAQNSPLAHGLISLNQMLKDVFSQLKKEDLFVITNSLSQESTQKDPPWILYRQINQKQFLKTIGIKKVQVEEHMTHDAHLFFETKEDLNKAKKILEAATIEGKSLFSIETYPDSPLKLFYRILFTDPLKKDAVLKIGDQVYPFFHLFKAIVQRTGKHIQTGTLLSNQKIFPDNLYNHEIALYLEKKISLRI